MPSIVIGNNQTRVKDCYASAPVIDLTLRTNGEEAPMIMDSLGQFVPAGIVAPTVAPSCAIGAAPGLTESQYVAYAYVYVCKSRYPLIENAITGGGSLAARSNPSPVTSQLTDATVGGKAIIVTVTKSTRLDVDKIWIYRTDYYTTAAEAVTAAEAGNAFWLAEIDNNGVAGTTTYNDATVTVSGNETLETDNFVAPQMQLCKFADPYFYGFGNFAFVANISIASSGIVTLTTAGDSWFDGRNGQLVTMEGITSGGFDSYGTFYFKWIDNQNAQLCLDASLLQNATAGFTGDTVITIKGPSTNLYRSKPRNPLSWGETEIIGEINVPSVYVRKIGGGQGTSIEIIPIINLLKLDTEGPNKTYVYNLAASGQPAFDLSKREISSDYSASNFWAQFNSKDKDGYGYLWFLDSKHKTLCRSDGSTNLDISSNVFASLRNMSKTYSDRLFSHGIYVPDLQLVCLWFTSNGSTIRNDKMLAYHHPTDTWSVLDQPGTLCSANFLNRNTDEQIILVGTESGQIGQAFFPDQYWDWMPVNDDHNIPCPTTFVTQTSLFLTTVFNEPLSMIGIWCYIGLLSDMSNNADEFARNKQIVGRVRISAYPGSGFTATFDKMIRLDGTEVTTLAELISDTSDYPSNGTILYIYPGMILCNGCKFIDSDSVRRIAVKGLYTTVEGVQSQYVSAVQSKSFHYQLNPDYAADELTQDDFVQDIRFVNSLTVATTGATWWGKESPFLVDLSRGFRVSFEDTGYGAFTWYNYSLALNSSNA